MLGTVLYMQAWHLSRILITLLNYYGYLWFISCVLFTLLNTYLILHQLGISYSLMWMTLVLCKENAITLNPNSAVVQKQMSINLSYNNSPAVCWRWQSWYIYVDRKFMNYILICKLKVKIYKVAIHTYQNRITNNRHESFYVYF